MKSEAHTSLRNRFFTMGDNHEEIRFKYDSRPLW